jgi:hypothetical protein
MSSTYLYICFSTQFFLYVLYNCIENSKTTVYFYDHEIKNYLLLTKASASSPGANKKISCESLYMKVYMK